MVKNVYESVFLSINIGQQKHILFERKNLFENGTQRQVRKPLKLMLFDFRLAVKFQVLIGGEHFQYGHFFGPLLIFPESYMPYVNARSILNTVTPVYIQ